VYYKGAKSLKQRYHFGETGEEKLGCEAVDWIQLDQSTNQGQLPSEINLNLSAP
jgi:hypothetical protein